MATHRVVLLGALAVLGGVTVHAGGADACIQYYGTSVDGTTKEVEHPIGGVIVGLTDHREHERRASAPLGPTPPDDAPVHVRSDHAAALIYHGRAREAVALLEAVERLHPGEYVVAANLGTAYELIGDDRQALRWITEGVRRNPTSHHGTEWLHVRILEAKLALAADPAWLTTHSVTGVDFGAGRKPVMPSQWPPGQGPDSTGEALRYQLHERMGFVKPPDPIVGALLADYADLTALESTVEDALPVYDLALEYRPARADLIQRRRAHLADMIEWRKLKAALVLWGLVAAGVVLLGALVALVVRRLRREKGTRSSIASERDR